jgi:uncharacterized protein YjaG (DUF416 family)
MGYIDTRNPPRAYDGSVRIRLPDFAQFCLSHGVGLYDEKELREDLQALHGLGLLVFEREAIVMSAEQINHYDKIIHSLREHPLRHKIPQLDKCIKKMEAVFEL